MWKDPNYAMIAAMRIGCLDNFNKAVDAGAYHSAKDLSGTPALVVAYQSDRPDYARRLIKLGADAHNLTDGHGDRLTHRAARTGNIGFMNVLLDAGVDPNVAGCKHRTALHHASRLGHDFAARILIEHKANVDAADDARETPLHLAARSPKSIGVVRELLSAYASTNAKCTTGYTPIHEAAAAGNVEAAKKMLAREKQRRTSTHEFIRFVETISKVAERHEQFEASEAIKTLAFEI